MKSDQENGTKNKSKVCSPPSRCCSKDEKRFQCCQLHQDACEPVGRRSLVVEDGQDVLVHILSRTL